MKHTTLLVWRWMCLTKKEEDVAEKLSMVTYPPSPQFLNRRSTVRLLARALGVSLLHRTRNSNLAREEGTQIA